MTQRLAFYILAVLCLVFIIYHASARASTPYELNYEEGNILNAGVRIVNGSGAYPDPRSFPYTLNPYGPVGYLLTAAVIRAFGVSLFAPRILVLLAGVGICFLIAAFVRRIGARWEVGLLFGALFLCAPPGRTWLPLLRVDFWAIFLSLLGLYIFLRFPHRWYLAALVFAAALLTKHTALAAPLACVLLLVFERRWRRAFAFGATLAGLILPSIFVFGDHFAFHLLKTHPDPYRIGQALSLYYSTFEGMALVIAVIVYSAATGLRWTDKSRLAWLYFAACSMTALTAGKLGSDTNHFLEWSAALCIIGALALSHMLDARESAAKPLQFGLTGLAILFSMYPGTWDAIRAGAGCPAAYAFVRSSGAERILSEDVAALVLNGKPVLVSNPFVTTQLGDSVAWSQGSIEQLVRRQYFGLILLGGDTQAFLPETGRWSSALIEAVQERYRPARRFQCSACLNVAYVPR